VHSVFTSARVRKDAAVGLRGKRESKATAGILTWLSGASLCLVLFASAQAQPFSTTPPRNVANEEFKEYCVFNDRLYSVGAFICVARRVSLQCERPDKDGRASWKSVASPDCELNQSLTPQ
jgi:Protein of unknown function (DUF1496)